MSRPTLLAITTYEKGQAFLRELARLGHRRTCHPRKN
jgi:hypothetical protein